MASLGLGDAAGHSTVAVARCGGDFSPGLSQAELDEHRLCPTDGVLERRLILPALKIASWVPIIPARPCIYSEKALSWRRWLFDQCHTGLLNAHRPRDQTFHMLRRLAYWPSLARDTER